MVPIRVPTPTTTNTRSSIQFIPKKAPLPGGADYRVPWCVRRADVDQKVSEPSPIPRLVPCLRSFEEQVEWRINESSKKAQVSWLPPCSIRVSALALILISASTTSNGGRAFGISLVVVIGWKASGCVVLPVHPSFLKQLEKREGTKREGFVKKAGTPRPPLGTERRPLRGVLVLPCRGRRR